MLAEAVRLVQSAGLLTTPDRQPELVLRRHLAALNLAAGSDPTAEAESAPPGAGASAAAARRPPRLLAPPDAARLLEVVRDDARQLAAIRRDEASCGIKIVSPGALPVMRPHPAFQQFWA